jgi:tetratricopeptide (TPR) repeat protein
MSSRWAQQAVWIGCLMTSLLGCRAAATDEADDAAEEDVEIGESESGVSLAAAEATFFEVLGGRTERRAEAIRELKAATRREPDNARAHLLLALARLSAVAEDNRLVSLPFIDKEFAAAQRLDPTDHRIPGWRVPLRVQFVAQPYLRGLTFLRPQLDQRMKELEDAATEFPQFVGFSAAMMMAPLPHDTGYPAKARAWADLLSKTECTPEFERFCGNTPLVPHNIEGQRVIYGDVYARAGDLAKAREQYELALAEPTASPSEWRHYAQAQERLDTVADRVRRWNDDDPKNDPAFFHEGKTACVGCHGR